MRLDVIEHDATKAALQPEFDNGSFEARCVATRDGGMVAKNDECINATSGFKGKTKTLGLVDRAIEA